jgi:hypothetical protein
MPDSDIINIYPIEQKVRDSSVLLALQRLHNDTAGKCKFWYTFDDLITTSSYHQMSYRVTSDGGGTLVSVGVVTTDPKMFCHVICTLFPIQSTGIFFTEDYFTQTT